MSAVSIPADLIAQLYAAIKMAGAYTRFDGDAPNRHIREELIRAESTLAVYLLPRMSPVEIEVVEPQPAPTEVPA